MKNKFGRSWKIWAAGLLITTVLTGCGAASDKLAAESMEAVSYSSAASPEGGYAYDMDGAVKDPGSGDGQEETGGSREILSESRKLIRTVDMTVETKEFDVFLTSLERQVQERGGYIESSELYNGSTYSGYRSSRDASLTLRIPAEELEAFLETVSEISNVVRRADSVEDVTLSYVDMESHRDALLTEQTRLMELLEKAESLTDILAIEERLTSVRYQLESMESQLRTMDNQVNYSTIYLYVNEVKELTPAEDKTIGERIGEGFVGSLKEVGEGAVDIFVWVAINLPHLCIWAAVIAAVILIFSRIRNRKKAGKKTEDKKIEDKRTEKKDTEDVL